MILGIKTASDETELVLEGMKDTWQSGRRLSDELLPHIEQLLAKQRKELSDLTGITVFRGPGSFTSLRIGITMANTLAYALQIPIVGADGDDWFADGLKTLADQREPQIITPLYGSDPHVTPPKK